MTKWIEALKVWNAEHNPGKWCVAKKGSAEYDQVKAIMEREKKAEPASERKAPAKKFEFKRKEVAKPASERKAPHDEAVKHEANKRDYATERQIIQAIVAKHVKRDMDADKKKALVAAFLKKMVDSKRKEKAAAGPKEAEGSHAEKAKLGKHNMLAQLEETLKSTVEAAAAAPPIRRKKLLEEAVKMRREISKLKKELKSA